MYVCWSVKGGSGTTVVAASLSLLSCAAGPTLLVDLCGDAPAALGMAEPDGPGVHDWLSSPTADARALHALAVPAREHLAVLPRGSARDPHPAIRWRALGAALHGMPGTVVVDAGVGEPADALVGNGGESYLVVRPCYMALRRAVLAQHRPTGVVLVTEPGRALGVVDVERAVGAPVVAQVPFDPAVARAVDSGLLATRLPRSIAHPLRGAA